MDGSHVEVLAGIFDRHVSDQPILVERTLLEFDRGVFYRNRALGQTAVIGVIGTVFQVQTLVESDFEVGDFNGEFRDLISVGTFNKYNLLRNTV